MFFPGASVAPGTATGALKVKFVRLSRGSANSATTATQITAVQLKRTAVLAGIGSLTARGCERRVAGGEQDARHRSTRGTDRSANRRKRGVFWRTDQLRDIQIFRTRRTATLGMRRYLLPWFN